LYPRITGLEDSDDEEAHPVIDLSFARLLPALVLAREVPSHVLECYHHQFRDPRFAERCQDAVYYLLDASEMSIDIRGLDAAVAMSIDRSVVEERRRVYLCTELVDGAYSSIPGAFTSNPRVGVVENRFAGRYGSAEGTSHCVAVETMDFGRRRTWVGSNYVWGNAPLELLVTMVFSRPLLDALGLDPSQAIESGVFVSRYAPRSDHRKEDLPEKLLLWIAGGRL